MTYKAEHKINGISLSDITKGDNAKSKKGRVVILVSDTLSGPVLHFCQGTKIILTCDVDLITGYNIIQYPFGI